MTDVKTFYVLQPPPVCSPSVSDSRILFQGGTERRQLLGQPLHHWVLQLGLMRAVETVKGIWIVQRIHLHTQIQGNVVFFLQLTVLTWVFLASWTNLSDILFPNVHKKIFFSFTPKCVFASLSGVSPSQWWCVQERERAARKSTAVFLHAKLLQKQLPWEALNWTAFPRQRGRKDPRLLTSACVLMRFSCYTNRLFDLSYRFHVFSLSFFSLYHFIPLHFNVFSTRSSPHHPTPSLLSFTVPLFHLLPLSLFVSILFLLSFLLSCITTTPFSQPICPQSHDHTPALQKGPCLGTATIGCSPLCGCESPNWASLWAGLWGSIFAWSRKPLTLN